MQTITVLAACRDSRLDYTGNSPYNYTLSATNLSVVTSLVETRYQTTPNSVN